MQGNISIKPQKPHEYISATSISLDTETSVSLVTPAQLSDCQLTDAEDDPVDVNGGEVQEKEGEVDGEKEEAQKDAHPLLEPFT